MRWFGDFDYSDYYGEGKGIVAILTCPSCGADCEFSLRDNDDN